jgi:hypothetical protein
VKKNKRFFNLNKKIDHLMINKEYFVSISSAKQVSYEEDYDNIAKNPDGKKRFLFKERKLFLKNNKFAVSL